MPKYNEAFNRLAVHLDDFWKDKGKSSPEINLDVKGMYKQAAKDDAAAVESPKSTETKPVAKEEKATDYASSIIDIKDLIDKGVETKLKTLASRIVEEKLRTHMSTTLTNLEQAVASKVDKLIKELAPTITAELAKAFPESGSVKPDSKTDTAVTESKKEEIVKDNTPKGFADMLMEDIPKSASKFNRNACEVMPGVVVIPNAIDKTVGDIHITQADGSIRKLAYTIPLPVTENDKEYAEQLHKTLVTITANE